nr:restriction endonuclease [uncultured Pedobacter sp.]
MVKYDYSTLTDKEFETLSCDLLNKEHDLGLQNFKKGKDKGIDLRYSTNDKHNSIVVQVKQYFTNPRVLYNSLKKELIKVKKLNPDQYWIVTSLPLSAVDKEMIVTLFIGYIKNTSHVIGQDDLDKLLRKHKEIEQSWLKLWLTSTSILKRVLNNAILGRSEFHREKILTKLRLFVNNGTLGAAESMLKTNKFLLISGQPGVGKTTLADILTYEFLAQKFEMIYIDKDLAEAGEVFEGKDKNLPQIIYFDDFLGANHLEIMNLKSSESAIVNFIERVQASKNKYMILTTRTTILKDARENYEKLNRSEIDLSKKELVISDYNQEDKARILYNHLYHSEIAEAFKKEVFENKNYWKIINHPNYTPRLIEFFTRPFNLTEISEGKYMDFVLHNLKYPDEIWRHSFTKQLHDEDRFLIGALYSFGSNFRYGNYSFESIVNLKPLQQAYESRVEYEVKTNGYKRKADSFNASLKRMIDGYLYSSIDKEKKDPDIRFINPSISDFLTLYYRKSREELWKLIYGCKFIHQLKFCFEKLIYFHEYDAYNEEAAQFIDFIFKSEAILEPTYHLDRYRKISKKNAHHCELIGLYDKARWTDEITEIVDPLIAGHLLNIDYSDLNDSCAEVLMDMIKEAKPKGVLYNQVIAQWDIIMSALWKNASQDDEFQNLEEIFELYDQSIEAFVRHPKHKKIVEKALASYADDDTYSWMMDKKRSIYTNKELEETKEKVREQREEIFSRFHVDDFGYNEDEYFEDVNIKENRRQRLVKAAEVHLSEDVKIEPKKEKQKDFSKIIDDLFSK